MPGTGYDKDAEHIGSLCQGYSRTKRLLIVLVFIVSVVAGMVLASLAKAEELVGTVTHVTDGDTFRLCRQGRCQSVRLCGVNSPEAHEPGFSPAREAMERLVINTTIVCRPVGEGTICDGRSPAKSHNRVVAQCFTAQGRDLAVEMLRAGQACECANFSGRQYRGKLCPPGTSGCGSGRK